MAKKSKYTKRLHRTAWILRVIDGIILIGPLLAYFIIGLINNNVVAEKIALVSTTAIALILTIFNIISKKRMRSAIWIMIIGIYIAVENIIYLIISIAIATILDEFVITPLINRMHTKYLASLTMDEREQFVE